MAKKGEIEYLKNLGEGGMAHARDKPFSDDLRGLLLMEIGALLCKLPPPPVRILDMGCGTGWTSIFLAKSGYSVLGVDLAPDMIALAEENRISAGVDNIRFEVADYESLNYENAFDAVIFYDCLHHAEDELMAVKSAFAALVPGGACYTFEPGKGHHAHEHSKQAMETFGVNEKDMPPSRIIELAYAAGFRQFENLPKPRIINDILYTRAAHQPKNPVKRMFKNNRFTKRFYSALVLGRQVYKTNDSGFVIAYKS